MKKIFTLSNANKETLLASVIMAVIVTFVAIYMQEREAVSYQLLAARLTTTDQNTFIYHLDSSKAIEPEKGEMAFFVSRKGKGKGAKGAEFFIARGF